jgi:hypothetical protein
MSTKTPADPRDSLHGEDEVKPRFGPGSDDAEASGDSSDPRGPDNIAAGKSSDPRGEKAMGLRDLDKAEDRGGVGSRGGVDSAESGVGDQLGKGYTGGVGAGGQMGKVMAILARNRKKTAGGIMGAAIMAMFLMLFMTAQGPLELVHLGEILQKNWEGQADTSSVRLRGMIRFAKTGEVGETRVNVFVSKRVQKILGELEKNGIEFPDRTALGGLKTMSIDPSNPDSPWYGMNEEQIRTDIGIPEDSGALKKAGSKFHLNIEAGGIRGLAEQRIIASSSIKTLGKGWISTGMMTRFFSKFFDVPTLWSPFRGLKRVAIEKLIAKLGTRKGQQEAEKERAKPRVDAVDSKFGAARSKLKDKISGKEKIISRSLFLTAGICLMRDIAGNVVEVNRGVASAATIESADKLAVGSSVKYGGPDADAKAFGAVDTSLRNDKGQTIWQGRALDATVHNGIGSGVEMPEEYGQAFHSNTTKDKILGGIASSGVTGAVCSTPGQIIQLVANVVFLITTVPVTGGASAVAAWGVDQSTSLAATAALAYLLEKEATTILSNDSIVPVPPTGPLGGNILAYGAREGGNLAARASGGVALANSSTTVVDKDIELRDQQEFQSRSFFARMFDVHDYRSLASNAIDSSGGSPVQEVASIFKGLTNIGGLLSKFFSSIIPGVSAASTQQDYYNWGFPRYGIPKSILNNPAYANPYHNAAKTAKILDSSAGSKYIDKAKKCFGVKVSKDDGLWSVTSPQDVSSDDTNPNSSEYIDAHCNNLSDGKWKRIILFVFDSRLVDSVNCYANEKDACDRLGVNVEETIDDSGGDGGAISGSLEDLAQQVLNNDNVIKSGRYVMEDLQHNANGQPA